MRLITTLFLLLLILIGISFACLNADPVTLNYYVGSGEIPLSLLLALILFFGAILGLLVGATWYIRLKTTNRKLQHKLKLAEIEISNLRAIPLRDQQ